MYLSQTVARSQTACALPVKSFARPKHTFSTSSFLQASHSRLPRSRRNETKQMFGRKPASGSVRSPTTKFEDLYPTAILQYANRSGFLTLTAEKAVEVIKDFEQRYQSAEILKKHEIKANDVSLLARVLLRTSHTKIARDMLMAAARLRDQSAIFLIIEEASKQGSLGASGVSFIYTTCFKPLVGKGNPRAVYLEAHLCERHGKNGEALSLYEELVSANDNASDNVENDVDYGVVWLAISKLRAKRGDRSGVEEAVSTAALQYDNAAAYLQMAKTLSKPFTAEYEAFLLKAAASGEAKASHELGVLYFRQSQHVIPGRNQEIPDKQPQSIKNKSEKEVMGADKGLALTPLAAATRRNIAQQWFTLGAEAGITGSKVYLAVLLHRSGKLAEGMQWLQSATESIDALRWEKVITYLAQVWENWDSYSELAHLDLEALRSGSVNASKVREGGG